MQSERQTYARLDGPSFAIAGRLERVRQLTMALAAPLSAEDCAVQSMPDASPTKWHLAHTSWFFETFVLQPHLDGYAVFDPAYRVLFNSYYVGIGERHPRPQRGLLTRPSLDEIRRYRAHVDAALAQLLRRPADLPPRVLDLIELGLQHEQQHQELILTDIKHALSCNPLHPGYLPPQPHPVSDAPEMRWVKFDGGTVRSGHEGQGFAFDNEGPAHDVLLRPFALASRAVTQGEYLAFIEDRGYDRPELWLSLGWETRQAQRWEAPLHWIRSDGRWRIFTMRGLADLDPDVPVAHLSYFEADAYARWRGARLPTEAEWESAARIGAPDPTAEGVPGNFLESGALEPRAAAGAGACLPLLQAFGDVWEWTSSAYAPYPGYRPAEGAVGEYNGKFMCNQYVLRGGSCVTPRSHVRPSYRNFFPPDARWQFSGCRLAQDLS
jgi:ergothioneine biosynthesis protein EgtB